MLMIAAHKDSDSAETWSTATNTGAKHNKEVNEVYTAHSTSIQYLTPFLLIYCCLLDYVRECIIFTVDYNIPLKEVLILLSG